MMTRYNASVDTSAAMPDRIRRLPISPQGFPVPFFVQWFDDGGPCPTGAGTPDFRVVDPRKMRRAVDNHFCWVCGGPMGVFKCFVIGPMCAINRVISEPPSHRDCAIYAARVCPFLANPRTRRNERDLYAADGTLRGGLGEPAGLHLDRNPGAVCAWITKSYRPFRPQAGNAGLLFSLGSPVEVLWFAQGRRATREEVMASIDGGYPTLEDFARQDGAAALTALARQRETAMALVPG
jgi:hypothetical protein